jgi:hypothetical protein
MNTIPGNSFVRTPSGSAGIQPIQAQQSGDEASRVQRETPRPVAGASEADRPRADSPRGTQVDIRV